MKSKATASVWDAVNEVWVEKTVTFTASADSDVPGIVEKTLGDGQEGIVGSTLPDSLTVVLKDQYGNPIDGTDLAKPIANRTVTFNITTNVDPGFVDGSLLDNPPGTPVDITTDSTGQAAVPFALGTQEGIYQITATAGAVPPETFDATAFAGPGARIFKNEDPAAINPPVAGSNDEQIALIGDTLVDPFKVKVTDKYGNPVEGWTVFFELVSPELATSPDGGPSLSAHEVTTAVDGLAQTTLTLGTVRGLDDNWKADGVEVDVDGQPVYYYYDLNGIKITGITPMAPDGKKDITGQKIPPGRNKVNAWILTGQSMEKLALDPDVDDSIDSMFTATGGGPYRIIISGVGGGDDQHGIVNYNAPDDIWQCILKEDLTIELEYDYPELALADPPVEIDWEVTAGPGSVTIDPIAPDDPVNDPPGPILGRKLATPEDSVWLILY